MTDSMRAHFNRRELTAITLYLGMASAIVQVILIRELLTIFRGNEIIIGFIYAAWFLGIYCGARFNRHGTPAKLEIRIRRSMVMLPLALVVSVYTAHGLPCITGRMPGTFYPVIMELVFSLVLTMPAGFYTGYIFPPVVSLMGSIQGEKSGGTVYSFESAGSFLGGLAFSFILVEFFNPLAIIALLLLCAWIILIRTMHARTRAFIILPLILFFSASPVEKTYFSFLWPRTNPGYLKEYTRTQYQHVSAGIFENSISFYGDGIHLFTLPDYHDSQPLYHLIMSLTGKNKGSILLFGVSPGYIPSALAGDDGFSVYYCETDPALWHMLAPYRAKFNDARGGGKSFNVIPRDLIDLLNTDSRVFDCIVISSPEPENLMLNRFHTREFYDLCRKHLSDTGILISAITGFNNYMSGPHQDFILSLHNAFAEIFPCSINTSGETIYLIGAKHGGILPPGHRELLDRYDRDTGPARAGELRMLFEESQLRYLDSVIVKRAGKIRANSAMRPGGYWNFMIYSLLMEQSPFITVTGGLAVIPVLLVIFTCITVLDTRKRFSIAISHNGSIMFLTGFIAISTMLIMIVLYQNDHGILYHRISLINALFMAGLAGGGYTNNRKHIFTLPILLGGLFITFSLILVYIQIKPAFLYWLIIPILAFFCGAIFPALFQSMPDRSHHDRASVLDAMDHFGSIVGSLLTVLVILPLFGIEASVMINMALLPAALLMHRLSIRASSAKRADI